MQQTIKIIDEMYINVPNVKYAFAEKKIGGKAVPKDFPIELHYTNRTGNVKTFTYNMEVIY